jgi:hypothetical protein
MPTLDLFLQTPNSRQAKAAMSLSALIFIFVVGGTIAYLQNDKELFHLKNNIHRISSHKNRFIKMKGDSMFIPIL